MSCLVIARYHESRITAAITLVPAVPFPFPYPAPSASPIQPIGVCASRLRRRTPIAAAMPAAEAVVITTLATGMSGIEITAAKSS